MIYRAFIILTFLGFCVGFAQISHAKVGEVYFCEDVDESEEFKSQFVLNWAKDNIFVKFLETDEVEGVASTDSIVFQNDHSLIAINPEVDQGASTFSLFESVEGIVTIRTYIESGRTFSKTAQCVTK